MARSVPHQRAFLAIVAAAVLTTSVPVTAQDDSKPIRDLTLQELMSRDIVPINVLGTHVHLAKQWMLAYEPMFMRMEGLREGTSEFLINDPKSRELYLGPRFSM